MSLPPLIEPSDVEQLLQRPLTDQERARARVAIVRLSAAYRDRSEQQVTPGRSEVRLKVDRGEVILPQQPAGTVHSVTSRGAPIRYKQDGPRLLVDLAAHRFVTVDYEHGGAVPDDLIELIAARVADDLDVPDDARRGTVQVTTTSGPFSEARTYAAWAQGGVSGLGPDLDAYADRQRRQRTSLIVMRS